MKSKVCDMLGIEVPIFAFSHCRDVVVEVSRAGGMGVLGVAGYSPERLEEELAWIDAKLDGKPYGVDILIPNTYQKMEGNNVNFAAMIPEANKQFLKTMCDEAGMAPLPAGEAEAMLAVEVDRIKMTPDQAQELIDVCVKHPIKLLVNALGTPPKEKVDALHALGIKVGSLVGKPEHALAQVAAGVDIIVAQGCEAGGHTGSITSMILWPQVIDAVGEVPVLAAGGIGRGKQMAAALAMGADGIWCGSIWLGTRQSELAPEIKHKFYAAKAEDAIQSRSLSGKPCRMLKSKYTEAFEQPGAPKTLPMPLQTLSTIEARMRIERSKAVDFMTYPVGQVVGDMKGETSVRQVVYDMMNELLESVEALNTKLGL